MIIEAEIKEWGNSYGIRIPKREAEKAGLKPGDRIDVPLERRGDIDRFFGLWRDIPSFERDRDDRF